MVLEGFLPFKVVLRSPWIAFFGASILTLICFFVAFFVFPQQVGLFSVFLLTIALTPLMNKLLKHQEVVEIKEITDDVVKDTTGFLARNLRIILVYASIFAGMSLTFSLIFLLLPAEISERIFEDQINTIHSIRGMLVFPSLLMEILINNFGVMILIFLFSFLFGAGAIFILAWNASVLATAVGIVARSLGGIKTLPKAFLLFLPHGSFELSAYFLSAIAGGILSAHLSRKNPYKLASILRDAFILLTFGICLLLIGAGVEVKLIA